jgi:hypothetical protein
MPGRSTAHVAQHPPDDLHPGMTDGAVDTVEFQLERAELNGLVEVGDGSLNVPVAASITSTSYDIPPICTSYTCRIMVRQKLSDALRFLRYDRSGCAQPALLLIYGVHQELSLHSETRF